MLDGRSVSLLWLVILLAAIQNRAVYLMSELEQGTAFYPILLFSVAQTRFF